MDNQVVVIIVPAASAYLATLRTAVGGVAARDRFSLDQVDDLRLAVEEAATQMLRHVIGEGRMRMAMARTDAGLEIRLSADGSPSGQVIDESSFSWRILRELADDLRVESQQSGSTIVLAKHRLIA